MFNERIIWKTKRNRDSKKRRGLLLNTLPYPTTPNGNTLYNVIIQILHEYIFVTPQYLKESSMAKCKTNVNWLAFFIDGF